jgi:hypothetical protein
LDKKTGGTGELNRGFGHNRRVRWITRGFAVTIGVAVIIVANSNAQRLFGVLLIVSAAVAGGVLETIRRRNPPADRHMYKRSFRSSEDDTYAALRRVVDELRYKRLEENVSRRTVAFNTGISGKTWAGQDYAAAVLRSDDSEAQIELVGGIAQRGLGRVQAVAWGETDALANKVLDSVERILAQNNGRP